MQEDIQVSRQIVGKFRSKFGHLHSNTFVDIKTAQHKDDPKYDAVLKKLEAVRQKYNLQVWILRLNHKKWLKTQNFDFPENFFKSIEKLKQLILSTDTANCGEVADLIQCEHLKKGIETHNVRLMIKDKTNPENILRDHVFSLRGLNPAADLSNPETWGHNTVLVDAWVANGITDQAIRPKGFIKKGALDQLLELFRLNLNKEKLEFSDSNSELAKEYIQNMKNQNR